MSNPDGAAVPSHSHILVYPLLASSALHADQLVRDIRSFRRKDAPYEYGSPSSSDSNPNATTPAPVAGSCIPWRISNKYYTASVAFRILPTAPAEEGDPIHSRLTEGDEPAVIVVAPASTSPSHSMTTLLNRLSSRIPEFEVSLLVTYSGSDSCGNDETPLDGEDPPVPNTDYAAWNDAALSVGFEWVHLEGPAAGGAHAAAPLTSSDGDEDVESPIGQIVAALHAHMWEGMERIEPARDGRSRVGASRASSLDGLSADAPEPGLGGHAEGDEEEWSALGAPPLPRPRVHYGGDQGNSKGNIAEWAFPERFLPSVIRPDECEDDFSPFVDAASSTTSFLDTIEQTHEAANDSSDENQAKSEHLLLSTDDRSRFGQTPSGTLLSVGHQIVVDHPSLTDGTAEEHDAELESLDDLFSRLSTARAATASMGFEERRAYAEKVIRELLGAEALDGLDNEGSEDEIQ